MLQHQRRFHGHGSVRRLYKNGGQIRRSAATLRFKHNPSRVHSRITIVVAKKVYKSAVKRNRIRRRLYEIIRRHWDELKHPYDYAVIVFEADFLVIPHDKLEEFVLSLFAQVKDRAD